MKVIFALLFVLVVSVGGFLVHLYVSYCGGHHNPIC